MQDRRRRSRRIRLEPLERRYLLTGSPLPSGGGLEEPPEGEAAPQVSLRLEAVDDGGAAIQDVSPGDEFFLRGAVRDLRNAARPGVFAAYLDVGFQANRVQPVRSDQFQLGFDVTFGPRYINGRSGNADVDGLLDELGAFQNSSQPLGPAEFLLFSARFQALGLSAVADEFEGIQEDAVDVPLAVLANDLVQSGLVPLTAGAADISPAHDVLLFDPPQVVPAERIQFTSTSVRITDDASLQVTSVTQPDQGGSVRISADASQVLYTPAPDFHGEESFRYTVNGIATADVRVTVDNVNDAPTGQADEYSADQNQILDVAAEDGVLANDTDPDDDTLEVARVERQPAHGSLDMDQAGSFRYTPNADFRGVDSFSYVASDGQDESAETEVRILVDPPQAALRATVTDLAGTPVASIEAGDRFEVRGTIEDIRVETAVAGVHAVAVDLLFEEALVQPVPDAGHPLGFRVRFASQYDGDVAGEVDGSGKINDLAATRSIEAPAGAGEKLWFVAEFEAVPPDPQDDRITGIPEDSRDVALQVLGNDGGDPEQADIDFAFADSPSREVELHTPREPVPAVDLVFADTGLQILPDSDPRIQEAGAGSHGGEVRVAPGGTHLLYTPAPNFHGTETLTYRTRGARTAQVEVVVDPVNDAPEARDDTFTASENRTLDVPAASGLLQNDEDVDGDAITAEVVEQPAMGTVTLDQDGAFRYVPQPGTHGTDTFTYRVSDGQLFSPPATVTIDVKPAPVAITLSTGSTAIPVGEPFYVDAIVQDQRDASVPQRGVFAAFVDVTFDADEVVPVPAPSHPLGFEIEFGSDYRTPGSGDASSPGLLDEVGSTQSGNDPLGGDPVTLFRASFEPIRPRANNDTFVVSQGSGTNRLPVLQNERLLQWDIVFQADPADRSPESDVQLFQPRESLESADVHLEGTSVTLRNPDDLGLVSIGAGSAGGTLSIAPGGQAVDYTPPVGFEGEETFSYTFRTAEGAEATGQVVAQVVKSWHNHRNPLDVNADGVVAPLDVLIVINELNENGTHELPSEAASPPFLDVNNDGFVSAIDVLIIINHLNEDEGEGEAEPAAGVEANTDAQGLLPEPDGIVETPDPAPVLPSHEPEPVSEPTSEPADNMPAASPDASPTATDVSEATPATGPEEDGDPQRPGEPARPDPVDELPPTSSGEGAQETAAEPVAEPSTPAETGPEETPSGRKGPGPGERRCNFHCPRPHDVDIRRFLDELRQRGYEVFVNPFCGTILRVPAFVDPNE